MITGRPVHRFSKKQLVIAPFAVLTTTLAAVAVGVPTAQATVGTNASFGAWDWSRFTEAQTDPSIPADPDGQAGDDNVANVIQIGERYEVQVPGTEYQSSGWVREAPDGSGWVQLPGAEGEKWVQDTAEHNTTVVDKAPWTETIPGTPSRWWNWSPNKTQGPFDGPPAFPTDPRGTWQGPHDDGGPGEDQTGTYEQGNGNGSWFHRDPGTQAQVIQHPATTHVEHHPAVAHQEFRYERLAPAHTEYYWSVYERSNTQAESGEVDPTGPTEPDRTTDPAGPSDPTEPARPIDPAGPAVPTVPSAPFETSTPHAGSTPTSFVLAAAASRPSVLGHPHRAGTHAGAVPASIDAGL